MKRKLAGYYSIFIGIAVIAMWLMILATEEIPEGKTEFSFHLFSEFLMAAICIAGGILVIKKNSMGRAVSFMGLGMVLYSVLNAAGYYGERDNSPVMVMFVILFLLTSAALVIQFDKSTDTRELSGR